MFIFYIFKKLFKTSAIKFFIKLEIIFKNYGIQTSLARRYPEDNLLSTL